MSDMDERAAARDAAYWAKSVSTLNVSEVPEGATGINVTGKRLAGPIQGFGKMWQKTYQVRLPGDAASPTEVIRTWKQRFPEFWPEGNMFYAPLTGIAPGEVGLIDMRLPGKMKLSTGVMVLYADDESFTLMTPQGHMFAGWITFSATEREGETVAQAQVLMRASDPIFELGLVLGGHKPGGHVLEPDARAAGGAFRPRRRGGRHAGGVRGQEAPVVQVDATCGIRRRSGRPSTRWARRCAGSGGRSAARARLPDAVVVGAGPERPGRGDRARPGRAIGPGAGGGAHGGGRVALGRADPPRLRARHLLGHPPAPARLPVPARGCRSTATGSSSCIPRSPWRTRSTTARRCCLHRSLAATAASIGGGDGRAYERMMGPLVRDAGKLLPAIFAPLRPSRHPLALARFGALGLLRPVDALARTAVRGPARAGAARGPGRSLDAADGRAADRGRRAPARPHRPRRRLAGRPRRLAASGRRARRPPALARRRDRDRAPGRERRRARRPAHGDARRHAASGPGAGRPPAPGALPAASCSRFRYGPGVFKLDWALDGPIPWRAPECARAGTVHVGGTLEEIAASEAAAVAGRIPERPYVLLAQQSACDPTRAPAGQHTGWAYCHVPSGSPEDMTERIEAQVERFAPGFRDRILARSVMGPAALERYDAELRRRRHQRRPPGPAPALHPPGDPPGPVHDARPAALHLLVVDAPRRRRPRHVRLPRRPGRATPLVAAPRPNVNGGWVGRVGRGRVRGDLGVSR